MSDESTAVLQGQLERALTGDAQARQRLLELTRDRLMAHARRLLHGRYARLEPLAQTDDVVQQLFLKILRNQDRFWVNAHGEPLHSLAEFFGHTSAWMRDRVLERLVGTGVVKLEQARITTGHGAKTKGEVITRNGGTVGRDGGTERPSHRWERR